MFETIVERILNRILGEYVEGFSSQNLKIGLWSGEVVIKNVALKKQIIKKLNLPFNLKYSRLGCLRLNIPWSSLASSKIDVVVEGLQVLITQIPEKQWQCKDTKIIEKRKEEIKNYCDAIIKQFLQKAQKSTKEQEEEGYFSKMIVKIIDNIQITVKDIHVRYEDEITNKFAFGVTLEELKIYTVNSKGEAQFIDRTKKQYQNQPLRKNLILSNFGVYWNENTQFFPENNMHQCMIDTIPRKNQPQKIKMNYLILMSSDAKLFQREAGKQFKEPQLELQIGFQELKLQISNEQLQQIVTLSQRLQKYTNQVKSQNRKKLTQLQMIANRQIFLQIFPRYFENTLKPGELEKVEAILEKMQVSVFTEGIKKYLQEKQKQKMIKQKKQKSKGWFSGPKELTEQQKKQIENFINENFGAPITVIKRPENFYYIQVNFVLKKLEIVIANNNIVKGTKDGIRSIFQEIKMEFNLREGGYLLNFGIQNFKVQLFKQLSNGDQNIVNIVQKLSNQIHQLENTQYVKLKVIGNPLDKKHLDTEIIVKTEQLLILFDPRIIKVAQDFADIKVSSQSTEAAFEAYGQIKKQTAELATESFQKYEKKTFLSIDAHLNAMNLILFFNPMQTQGDIWAISLGNISVFTDPYVLQKSQFTYNEPMEKYCMKFQDISMAHHQNKNKFLERRLSKQVVSKNSQLLDKLNADFEMQIYQKPTDYIPKFKARAIMHSIDLWISDYTYKNVQKIGDCFVIPNTETVLKKKQQQKVLQKSEVMKGAKKIGMLWQQSKEAKKYIAVLNGGYLYLYADKKDVYYSEYYYIKNSDFTVLDKTNVDQKQFGLVIQNAVNKVYLGFDKEEVMHDWMKVIKSLQDEQYKIIDEVQEEKKEQKKKVQPKQISPNQLNFEVEAKIERIHITTLISAQSSIKIGIQQLGSQVKLHEAKTILDVSLKSIQLKDNIYNYKYRELDNFLYSQAIEGASKLIDIKIKQLALKHPEYCHVDSLIDVNFGKLIFNYKPETVESVMLFFLPKSEKIEPVVKEDSKVDKTITLSQKEEKNKRKALQLLGEIILGQPERFSMKVNVCIQEVSVSLVNRKNRVMFGRLGLTGFKLLFGQSTRKMLLSGGLEEMWFIDYSRYPYTIVEQQEKYDSIDYLLQSGKKEQDMMQFNIQILEILNQNGKNMLINTKINDLKVSYVQQPVLRILTYLTEQMLPSLTPDGSPEDKKKAPPLNDTKPTKGTMQLSTVLSNIVVYISPRSGIKQYLLVNVKDIVVSNSALFRPFIKNADPNNESEAVLVENYSIFMKGINLTAMYNGIQTKLTNDIGFDVSCDLIQNAPYYHKIFKERFDAGMRINCHMAPFLMKINHDDYNFMMKCLNWCISYDDNAQGYMFNMATPPTNEKGQVAKADPMYFNLEMERIALCVTQNNLPISVLNLNVMKYSLTMNESGMLMDLTMKNLFGTNIHKTDKPNVSQQLGLFNAFGYERELKTDELYDIDNLVKLVSRQDMVYKDKSIPDIVFFMEMSKNGDMFIDLKIQALKITIQLRNLLILSKLAMMEDNIQAPKPTLKPLNKPVPVPSEKVGGKMQIVFQMNNFLGSLSDATNQNFIVMEGQIIAKLLMLPRKSDAQVLKVAHTFSDQYTMQLASHVFQVRGFSFYFCNIKDRSNRRYILQPFNIYIAMKQYFSKKQSQVFNNTQIEGSLDKIIIQSSVRDMLKISVISQDNLKKLSDSSQPPKPKEEDGPVRISNLTQEKEANTELIKQTMKVLEKKIIPKTKANINLQPMQIRIINDCDNNFMPVINFIIQESVLMFRADAIKSHLTQQNITIKMDFFNPRSSDWEPVLETFRVSFDFLTLVHEYGQQSKIILTSSDIEQLSEMKLNVSTQFIRSLMATLQIANIQQKKLKEKVIKNTVQEIQVSPYIIQNLTYSDIIIHRNISGASNQFVMPPLFKGPVRLSDNAQKIDFTLMKLRYSINLDKYGTNRIPGKPAFYLDFTVDKLNRVIKFVNSTLIKNNTSVTLYCLRYDSIPKLLESTPLQIQPGQLLPVKQNGYIQLSFNSKTFTHMTPMNKINQQYEIRAQSEKFKLSICEKKTSLGHSVYNVWPPLVINNCLPKDIKLQFIIKGKTASTKDIPAQQDHQVFANEQIFNLRFKIITDGFYWSQQFGANPAMFGRQQILYLSDREEGGTSLKFIIQKKQSRNMFNFNIFCPAYIVSQLDYGLEIYGNLQVDEKNKSIQKYYLLGGQSEYWKQDKISKGQDRAVDKITFIGAETGNKVRMCGRGCLVDFSQPVVISGLGINQSRVVIEREINGKKMSVFTNIGAEIALKKMGKNSQIYSREITLRSRSIVLNETKFTFEIKEQGGQKYFFQIDSHEKKSFYFTMPELKQRPRGLVFKIPSTKNSVPIMSNGLGSIYFRLEKLDSFSEYLYFKLTIQEIKSYIFYVITQVDYNNLPYQIVMKTDKLEAMAPQLGNKLLRKGGQQVLFINQLPQQTFKLYLQIRAPGGRSYQQVNVTVDDLNFSHHFNYFQQGVTEMFLSGTVYVIFNDNKKFIVIDQRYKKKDDTPEFNVQTMNVKIQKISVSLISNHAQLENCRPYQSFYFYMYNLEFISEKTNKRTRYQSKLQFLQLDQNQPFNLANPVIMTPYRYKQFIEQDPKTKRCKAIFNSLIEIDNSFVKNMLFNIIAVEINDLVLHADTQFIKLILRIAKQFQEVMNTNNANKLIQKKINTWSEIKIPEEGSKTFIKAIKIAPFTIEISAEVRLNELDTESVIFFGTVINALGVVITNIQGAPIVFDGIAINDCVDTMQGINQKLMEHYKSSVIKQLYKVFGALNIIGNPVSLFRNISTGFKDLKDKPSQGFVEGPLQFGKGLAQGTSSLIAHSVGGALNSVEKVTGTIASGLAVLTFDKQFEEMREKQKMKKPKHVFQGLEKGGKAVFHGFKEGITGVFTKPYENSKKQGVVGFFKGTAQGMAGLVVKPVTGIVDFASKTTEGLKNTALYLQDKPNQNRIRYPRVFYTQLSNVRQYNPVDSKLYAIINKTKYEEKYGFENTLFIESFTISDREFLLVLMEDIILIRIDDEKIEWAVPIEDSEIKPENKGVRVLAKNKRQWYSKKIEELVIFKDINQQKKFEVLIKNLTSSMRDRVAQMKHIED